MFLSGTLNPIYSHWHAANAAHYIQGVLINAGLDFEQPQQNLNEKITFSSSSKIFRTKSQDVVDECMPLFGRSSVLTVVSKRKAKFLDDYLIVQ